MVRATSSDFSKIAAPMDPVEVGRAAVVNSQIKIPKTRERRIAVVCFIIKNLLLKSGGHFLSCEVSGLITGHLLVA
jgi:hypothetical protein